MNRADTGGPGAARSATGGPSTTDRTGATGRASATSRTGDATTGGAPGIPPIGASGTTARSRSEFRARSHAHWSHLPSTHGLPRALPWESPMTRVWTGTKFLALTVLSTALLAWPGWGGLASVAAAMLAASLAARVPLAALPRFPPWFWGGLVGGLVGASIGGGLWLFVRAILVGAVVLWGSMLLVWTTPLERMTPALRTLMAPLRLVHVPVDEWATTMGFALRGLPAIQDQTSAVVDTVRLRSGGRPPTGLRTSLRVAVDVVTASLSAASRRATDTGRAMTLRGGVPEVPVARERPGWRDLVVAGATVAATVLVHALRDGLPPAWGATLAASWDAVAGWVGSVVPLP